MKTNRLARGVSFASFLFAGPLFAACASPAPDVVATQVPARNDGGGFKFTERHACREGRYGGSFASSSVDGGFASTLRGPIAFELVRQGAGEFFTVTHGDKLDGKSEQGDSFSADIVADDQGACHEGQFTVHLDGLYTPVGTTNEYRFTGNVEGKYLASEDAEGTEGFFIGRWQAFFLGSQIAEGTWSALWFGPGRGP
jgi:hypothetical protein